MQDPVLRSAIETHAVEEAIAYYARLGGHGFEKLGKPYDVRLWLDGVQRHVEVKGSSLLVETVELTINEVTHARGFQPTDLVVVDDIGWARSDGGVTTAGGATANLVGLGSSYDDLLARRFAYALPREGTAS